MTRPGIVNVCRFVEAGHKKFGTYVDYVDRNEAIRNTHFNTFNVAEYDGYHHYMENPTKSSGLFTAKQNQLNGQEKNQVKELFQLAQKNGSVMWQDVLSFDNAFLQEEGLYNPNTGYLHETAIQEAVRDSMQTMLEREGMEASAVWTASIHFNTDNIHVHIATVEPHPTRPLREFRNTKTGQMYLARKGSRRQGTLDQMKAKVIGRLTNRDKELERVAELVRTQMIPTEERMRTFLTLPMQEIMQDIYQSLPDDLRKWRYNMNALDTIRPKLDVLTTMYVNQFHPEDRSELNQRLLDQTQFYKRVYGEGTKEAGRYDDYKTNKEQEFYARMGNAFLKEMKTIRQADRQDFQTKYGPHTPFRPAVLHRNTLQRLKKSLQKDYRNIRNQRKYQELQVEELEPLEEIPTNTTILVSPDLM